MLYKLLMGLFKSQTDVWFSHASARAHMSRLRNQRGSLQHFGCVRLADRYNHEQLRARRQAKWTNCRELCLRKKVNHANAGEQVNTVVWFAYTMQDTHSWWGINSLLVHATLISLSAVGYSVFFGFSWPFHKGFNMFWAHKWHLVFFFSSHFDHNI